MTPTDPALTRFRVLVVDDMEANVALIRRMLRDTEFDPRATLDPGEALDIVRNGLTDVVVLDVRMPGRNGFDVCRELKAHQATRFVPIILVTAEHDPADRLRAIEAGADDFIAKPINHVELKARLRSLARMKRSIDELENAEEVIVSLALTIEARDAYTDGHCQRLATYAVRMGQALGLDVTALRALQRGGFLHDVGKIAIPDAVLQKRGPLNDDELAVIRTHPEVGERLCGELRTLIDVRPIVRSHHERADGSGYPDGLTLRETSVLARIISVVDVYDALTTDRPYRAALAPPDAFATLREEAARGWRDQDLVELLIDLASQGQLAAG